MKHIVLLVLFNIVISISTSNVLADPVTEDNLAAPMSNGILNDFIVDNQNMLAMQHKFNNPPSEKAEKGSEPMSLS